MNNEMVNPIPASAAPPPSCLWVKPGGSSAQGVRAARRSAEQHSPELAEHQTGDHPPGET